MIFPPTSGIKITKATLSADRTQLKLTLQFSGDFDANPTTLTIAVRGGAIENADKANYPVTLSIIPTQESLTATTTPTSLTEATLGGSEMTLTLQGRTFEDPQEIKEATSFSGIGGVTVGTVERLSDTQVKIGVQYSGNFQGDRTLTLRMIDEGIKNYSGSSLTVALSVTSVTESITAATSTPLTEATLDGSTVTLTLQGRTFENNLTGTLAVIGLGTAAKIGTVTRTSDTQVTVQLRFDGNFDGNATLTFWVTTDGIKHYQGPQFTTNALPVTATTESLSATAPAALTEATLDGSTVTLTLQGRTFEANVGRFVSVSGIEGVTAGTIQRINDTQITVPLQFSGDFDSNSTLTFTVNEQDIKNYRFSLRAELPVTAIVETTPQQPVVTTPQPVVNTPQPTVVTIPDANLRAAIQQVIGNTITTDTLLNLTYLHASNRGVTNLSGLEHAKNLSSLHLFENSITDISPIAGLTQLTKLFLSNNSITDISALSGLKQLTWLELKHNSLSNISALSGLKQLTTLNLHNANISDLSPLSGLTQLTTLYLYNEIALEIVSRTSNTAPLNRISDLSPLARLTQLNHLHLYGNNISDVSGLVGLRQLAYLNLRANPLDAAAINTHIPAIQDRGTEVLFDNRAPTTPQPKTVAPTPEPPVAPTPQTPDLTVSNFRVSKTTVAPGEQFTLFATVENRGTQQSPATPLQFQRSTDDFYTQIGTRNVSALGANRSVEVNFSTTAPAQAGVYHYRAYIQIANQHSSWSTITVAAPATVPVVPTPQPPVGTPQVPDLVVSDFRASKTALALGESFQLFTTLKNQGTGTVATATLSFYGATDNVNWSDERKLATADRGPLQPNGTVEVNPTFTDLSPAGTYYFYACIDPVSNESTTNNNCSAAVQITVGAPATTPAVNTPQPNVPPPPQPNVVNTPQPNVVSTPPSTVVTIPDRNLRAVIREEVGNTLTTETMGTLTSLDAYDSRIRDLTGLEHATNLSELDLGGNNISDISVLAGLTHLESLYLDDNNISDISPLVGLTRLTDLSLTENPLNAAAISTHIPAIQANGTQVEFDDRAPTTPPATAVNNPQVDTRTPTVRIDTSQPAIYWDWNGIQYATLDGSNVQTLVPEVDVSDITLDVIGGKMYWINYESIQCANLDGSQVETLVNTGGTSGASDLELTLDVSGGKMYWRHSKWDAGTSEIRRANLNGSQVETLVRPGIPVSFALDVSGGKMYWTDDMGIRRANLNGANVETLVRATRVWDLTLDVSGGKMYWTDDMGIRRANLNGANVETLVGARGAQYLALDVSGGKMYWVGWEDEGASNILRANLNGANVETLVRATRVWNLTLDISGRKIYWANSGENDTIWRANLDGSNREGISSTSRGAFALIPSQAPAGTTSTPAVRTTTQVHVDAVDRPPMYWIDTQAGTLHRLVDAEVENLVPSVRNATSLTLDVANDTLYWTEATSNTTGRIRSANLNGTNAQLVKELTSLPLDITFNPADSKLYLTNGWGKMQRLNVDGSGFQPNLITDLETPLNIIVDVANEKLYWTEATGNTGSIRSANLDGTNVQLVKNLTSVPLDMSFDAFNATLYWTNASGAVQRINVDGSGFQPNFITGLGSGLNIAVDTAWQKLYLTSPDGKITRRDLSGGNAEDVVTGLGSPGGLVFGDDDLMDDDDSMADDLMDDDDSMADDLMDDDGSMAVEPLATTDRAEDVNQDGKVDNVDLGMVAAALFGGNPPAILGRLDVNGDGKLTIDDLTQVSNNLDAEEAAAAPALGIRLNALAREKIQAHIDLLRATDAGSLGVRRTLVYLQNLLAAARPDETVLLANYPNPFNPETWMPYELATDSDVRITIYDTRGKVVRRLVLGHQPAGYYTSRSRAAYWDGRNTIGEQVASGIYFYQFETDEMSSMRKMVILK